jgi:hypothetical protein
MVARINTSKSISKALNYNEKKVQQGKAEALAEFGFIKDVDKMNFYDKLSHFERFTSLNEKATTNTLHVSLNFDPSEKLSDEKLIQVAESYMQKIGFGKQPYLVYRHDDAGHPHIHIVSTNIERDGKRISMHNMGRNQSEKARKEIEVDFGLVKADSKKNADVSKLVPVNAQKISYGKSDSRRAIANVLMGVLNQYKFTSLPELNVVLKLYNVTAERGAEDSRMFLQKGLTYRILDDKGNKIGTPIKASSFYMKPTLNNLERKFGENESLKTPYRKRLQTAIGWILNKQPASLQAFIKALEKENISTVIRTGKDGVIYGVTYVDHKTKCVFNGSDLGKQYSAKAILEKCRQENVSMPEAIYKRQEKKGQNQSPHPENKKATSQSHQAGWKLPTAGTSAVPAGNYMPHQLKGKKKKKKRRISI